MDDLRSNVQHARHEQKGSTSYLQFESYELFKKMVSKVNAEVASFLMKCTIPSNPNEQKITRTRKQDNSPQGTTSKKKELKTFHNRDLMPLEVWLDQG